MNPYKYPKWARTHYKPAEVTDEQLAEWRADAVQVSGENNAKYAELVAAFNTMAELAKKVWGDKSLQHKYILRNRVPTPSYHLHDFEVRCEAEVKKARKAVQDAKEKAEREAKYEAQRIEMQAKAVLYLQERGKVLGKDYQAPEAIETANEIAFNEAVDLRDRMGRAGEYFEFEGNYTCDSGCLGWEGTKDHHRCSCGNRRVSWVRSDSFSFETPYIYAEAY